MKVMDSEPQEEPLAPESIEPATPIERRNAAGWILMIVLISLMMVGAMSAYLKPQDSKQKRYEAVWTPSQFAAVSFHFIDNETVDEPLTSALYTIAEEVCGKLPNNLRPIP